MPVELKMPALSPTMEEGTLAKWLVKEGDDVKSGDILAEIETDKATMEFEAVDEGTIASIAVAEGTDGVKVGTVIATLAGEDEDAAERPEPGRGPGVRREETGRDDVLDLRRAGQGIHREGEGTERNRSRDQALGDVALAEQFGRERIDREHDDEQRHAAVGQQGADRDDR